MCLAPRGPWPSPSCLAVASPTPDPPCLPIPALPLVLHELGACSLVFCMCMTRHGQGVPTPGLPRLPCALLQVLQELGAIRDSLCGGGGPGGGGTITVPLAQAKSEATRILQSHLQIVSGKGTTMSRGRGGGRGVGIAGARVVEPACRASVLVRAWAEVERGGGGRDGAHGVR